MTIDGNPVEVLKTLMQFTAIMRIDVSGGLHVATDILALMGEARVDSYD